MLINVNYGELLGAALENVTDIISNLTNVLPPTFRFEPNYFRQSRGKLTLYKVSPILFENLPLTAILFTVTPSNRGLLALLLRLQKLLPADPQPEPGPHRAIRDDQAVQVLLLELGRRGFPALRTGAQRI